MNRVSVFCSIFVVIILAITNIAQVTDPVDEDDVVKINTSIVQLDAVVTDKDGNPVFDLNRNDFEILQDGKPRKISSFSFIDTSTQIQNVGAKKETPRKTPIPTARQRLNTTGRVITFIVDDGNCTSSQVGMFAAQKGLETFVNEQMFASDLVAIYRTRSGSSLLQQYTSDKEQLMKVVKKIRWFPNLGCNNNGDFFAAARLNDSADSDGDEVDPNDPSGDGLSPNERNRQNQQAIDDQNRDNQIVGTLGVLRYIVRGLDRVPGRKIVFLLSDGIPTLDENGNAGRSREVLRGLTDEANRSSVVLNTVDVRGVNNPEFLSAADDIKVLGDFGPGKSVTDDISNRRSAQSRDQQNGLAFLAEETGGNFYRGNNDLGVHLNRAMKIEKGYYLLGYEPEEESFRGTKFHSIEIKLRRPELKVYSRAGFIGRVDSAVKNSRPKSDLYEAITTPLPQAGLGIRLTAFYGNTAREGNYVRSLIHIEGKDISFTEAENGFKKAIFDVVAVTFNEKNEVVDEFNRTHTIKVDERAVPYIRENGLTYSADVSIKKFGAYSFRVALKDTNSGLIGSAMQFVEIPKWRKGKIYISGLTVSSVDGSGKYDSPSAKKPDLAISLVASKGNAAIRTFRSGEKLAYSYNLYNIQVDSKTKAPKVRVAMNLYKDGEIVAKGDFKTVDFTDQPDLSRIEAFGYFGIGENVVVGDYVLQIIVNDAIGKSIASQSIDFEIVN